MFMGERTRVKTEVRFVMSRPFAGRHGPAARTGLSAHLRSTARPVGYLKGSIQHSRPLLHFAQAVTCVRA
jgi:hypothetical protein